MNQIRMNLASERYGPFERVRQVPLREPTDSVVPKNGGDQPVGSNGSINCFNYFEIRSNLFGQLESLSFDLFAELSGFFSDFEGKRSN